MFLKTNKRKFKKKQGYITLTSMLIVSAVGIAIVVSLLLKSVDLVRTNTVMEQSKKARFLADACAEEALRQIWNSDIYVGSGELSFEEGSCNYSVSGVSVPKTVDASGLVDSVVRNVSITVDSLHPYVSVNPWQETP